MLVFDMFLVGNHKKKSQLHQIAIYSGTLTRTLDYSVDSLRRGDAVWWLPPSARSVFATIFLLAHSWWNIHRCSDGVHRGVWLMDDDHTRSKLTGLFNDYKRHVETLYLFVCYVGQGVSGVFFPRCGCAQAHSWALYRTMNANNNKNHFLLCFTRFDLVFVFAFEAHEFLFVFNYLWRSAHIAGGSRCLKECWI